MVLSAAHGDHLAGLYPVLLTAARSVLRDADDSHDAAHDAAVKLLRIWDQYDPKRSSRVTWAYVVTRNVARDWRRHRDARIRAERQLTVHAHDQVTDPERVACDRASIAEVWGRLTDHERTYVLLEASGMTIQEVAVATRTPSGTVKTRRMRMRLRLQQERIA